MSSSSQMAILVVEYQKTWTERSFFHRLIRKQYESRNVYPNTRRLLDVARKRGLTVIQSPFILDRKEKATYRAIPFLPKLFGQFTAGTWRAEYTEGIFDESDVEVHGRTGFDNTKGSDLRAILEERGIKTIYFTGFTTDHCVAKTMDTLQSDGYECILVSDCTATRNSKAQQKVEGMYRCITAAELIEKLEAL
ncbi:MAG: cysteine hydrolase [Acidobacteria bacterium]|nr:cysteine hydrolase [Acidobacteriota bacterium]